MEEAVRRSPTPTSLCTLRTARLQDQAAAHQPQAGMARVPPRTSFHSARTSRDLRQASAAGSCATSAAAASGGPGIPRPSSTSRLAAAGIPRPGSAGRLAAAGLPRPGSASRLAATSALRGSGASDREAWPHNYDQSPSSTTATASLSSGRSGRLHPGSSGTAQDAFGGYEAALPPAVRLSMEICLEMDRYVSDWEIPPEGVCNFLPGLLYGVLGALFGGGCLGVRMCACGGVPSGPALHAHTNCCVCLPVVLEVLVFQ